MTDVEETRLPGVGIRHDFVTGAGKRIGMLSHFSGRRELLIYDDRDPDACREIVELDEDDTRLLAELLGADHVAEHLIGLQQSLKGLAIDWLPVEAPVAGAGGAVRDVGLVGEEGVSVVAVIRAGEPVPAPPAQFALRAGDTVVVVGTPPGIRQALVRLRGE